MKILLIYGTRPEFLKLIPVIKLMKDDNFFELTTVYTGQHRDLMTDLYENFKFKPDIEFDVMEDNQTPSDVIVKTQILLCDFTRKNKFDYIMVQGDTATVFSGALTGFLNKIPVIHVEAGMRTFDITQPFPEEGFRQMISMITRIHFTPTSMAAQRLNKQLSYNHYTKHDEKTGKDELKHPVILNIGNTIIDTVNLATEMIISKDYIRKDYKLDCDKIVTLTLHRRENHDVLDEILDTIYEMATLNPYVKFVFPVHPNPNVKDKVVKLLGDLANVNLIDPLNYLDMISLLKQTDILMTDSGGLQEEAAALNIPTIVLRETTERMEGIKNGNAVMGYTNSKSIKEAFTKVFDDEEFYEKMLTAKNPYGDGKASKRIVDYLRGL